MDEMTIDSCAVGLYDSGWRADDRDELIRVYHLSLKDADGICERLAKLDAYER